MFLLALIAFQVTSGAQSRCAFDHEDCSHTGCCSDASKKCYKKNNGWSGCRPDCTPGIHHHDPPAERTSWSCELVTPHKKDCAAAHENCGHLGCCKDHGSKCYEKDVHWAGCLSSCTPGIHHEEKSKHQSPWSCRVIHPHEGNGGGTGGGTGSSTPSGAGGWTGTLESTHFWDCNGFACEDRKSVV